MGKRSISDDDIVRIFNTVKALNPGPFKIIDVVKDLKKNGPLYKTRVIELITISRKEMAKIQRDAYAKRMAIKAGTYVAPPKPKPQAEMEAIKFLKSRGYRITKLITVEQIV